MEIRSVVHELFDMNTLIEGNTYVFIFVTFCCELAKRYRKICFSFSLQLDFCVASKNNELGELPLGV